jgi:hypothetical protein
VVSALSFRHSMVPGCGTRVILYSSVYLTHNMMLFVETRRISDGVIDG